MHQPFPTIDGEEIIHDRGLTTSSTPKKPEVSVETAFTTNAVYIVRANDSVKIGQLYDKLRVFSFQFEDHFDLAEDDAVNHPSPCVISVDEEKNTVQITCRFKPMSGQAFENLQHDIQTFFGDATKQPVIQR